ncbi:hypothetical protein D9M71_578300 [compost metagenome]
MQAKQALQLPPRHLDRFRQFQRAQRRFAVLLHLADHVNQLLVADAITGGDFHALMVFARADAAKHELLADLDRQLRAMGLGDQIQH